MSEQKSKAILAEEKQILKEEKEILREVKKEEVEIKKAGKNIMAVAYGGLAIVLLSIGFGIYWMYRSNRIFIDKSEINAPLIQLGPSSSGILQEVKVHAGDEVLPDTVVAIVGTESIKTKVGGLIVDTNQDIGKRVNPADAIVTMIDPTDLRVIGRLEEDKGLKDVQIGQQATFTVDAFGGRTFYGVVDSISSTSRDSGIVFNISDKREVKEFEIKVRFSRDAYPELKNGMSAKIVIQK